MRLGKHKQYFKLGAVGFLIDLQNHSVNLPATRNNAVRFTVGSVHAPLNGFAGYDFPITVNVAIAPNSAAAPYRNAH